MCAVTVLRAAEGAAGPRAPQALGLLRLRLTPGVKEQCAESTGGACRLPSTRQKSEDGSPAFLELKVLRHLYRVGDRLVSPGGRTEGGAGIYLKVSWVVIFPGSCVFGLSVLSGLAFEPSFRYVMQTSALSAWATADLFSKLGGGK